MAQPPIHPFLLPRPPVARDLSATRQEHNQALEKLSREHKLEIEAMEHASLLKKKELEVCVCGGGGEGWVKRSATMECG